MAGPNELETDLRIRLPHARAVPMGILRFPAGRLRFVRSSLIGEGGEDHLRAEDGATVPVRIAAPKQYHDLEFCPPNLTSDVGLVYVAGVLCRVVAVGNYRSVYPSYVGLVRRVVSRSHRGSGRCVSCLPEGVIEGSAPRRSGNAGNRCDRAGCSGTWCGVDDPSPGSPADLEAIRT